ncbi:MAG: hypothetical protein JST00_37725 [Deltaproteobacteria bacterium]|nr:hypothetical protein [Deltaproteobacteria bacterium]
MSPLRKLAAIVGLPPRVQAVGDRIRRLGDEGFVAALSELARDAARGARVADADAMLACALFFLRGEPDRLAPLVAAARRTGDGVALAMLDDAPAHKALSYRGRLRDQGAPRKVVREAWVSTTSAPEEESDPWDDAPWNDEPSRDPPPFGVLAFEDGMPGPTPERELVRLPPANVAMQARQLTSHNAPGVIRSLLLENVTGLREVVRIASRRPTMPSIVAEIVAHDRWIARMEVRTALVQNPFTPTRTALLLLPTCHARCELSDGAVHPRLRELSALLVPTT